ncbi:MAG: SMC-Scp complex subunit ScpB [Clostridia bacterium]
MSEEKEIIKAILFVAGDGVDIDDISSKLDITKENMLKFVNELKKELAGACGIHLISYKNKIQLCSNPQFANQIANVLNPIRQRALTKSALETLAIIAYKQPITKLEIEEIRGRSSEYTVQVLSEHNLIAIVGQKDALGRPFLFGTTDEFLKRFGLENINFLPDYDELISKIQQLRTNEKEDGLYFDYKVPTEEIEVEENNNKTLTAQNEGLSEFNEFASKEKLQNIDEMLKKIAKDTNTISSNSLYDMEYHEKTGESQKY